MKALMKKDFLQLKRDFRIYILFFIGYGALDLVMGTETSFVSTLALVSSLMIPMTTMAYDEQTGWNRYQRCLPVSVTQIALEKYVICFLTVLFFQAFALACSIGSALIHGEHTVADAFGTIAMTTLVAALIVDLQIPVGFRFGSQKARFVILAIVAGGMLFFFLSLTSPYGFSGIESVAERLNEWTVAAVFAALTLVLTAVSMAVSVVVCRRKEWA